VKPGGPSIADSTSNHLSGASPFYCMVTVLNFRTAWLPSEDEDLHALNEALFCLIENWRTMPLFLLIRLTKEMRSMSG
jgi:hypothetical protein